jgi:hypothetical protein
MIKELISFLFSLIKFLVNLERKNKANTKTSEIYEDVKEVVTSLEKENQSALEEIKNKIIPDVNPALFDKTKSSKELLEILIEDEDDEKMKDILLRLRKHMSN